MDDGGGGRLHARHGAAWERHGCAVRVRSGDGAEPCAVHGPTLPVGRRRLEEERRSGRRLRARADRLRRGAERGLHVRVLLPHLRGEPCARVEDGLRRQAALAQPRCLVHHGLRTEALDARARDLRRLSGRPFLPGRREHRGDAGRMASCGTRLFGAGADVPPLSRLQGGGHGRLRGRDGRRGQPHHGEGRGTHLSGQEHGRQPGPFARRRHGRGAHLRRRARARGLPPLPGDRFRRRPPVGRPRHGGLVLARCGGPADHVPRRQREAPGRAVDPGPFARRTRRRRVGGFRARRRHLRRRAGGLDEGARAGERRLARLPDEQRTQRLSQGRGLAGPSRGEPDAGVPLPPRPCARRRTEQQPEQLRSLLLQLPQDARQPGQRDVSLPHQDDNGREGRVVRRARRRRRLAPCRVCPRRRGAAHVGLPGRRAARHAPRPAQDVGRPGLRLRVRPGPRERPAALRRVDRRDPPHAPRAAPRRVPRVQRRSRRHARAHPLRRRPVGRALCLPRCAGAGGRLSGGLSGARVHGPARGRDRYGAGGPRRAEQARAEARRRRGRLDRPCPACAGPRHGRVLLASLREGGALARRAGHLDPAGQERPGVHEQRADPVGLRLRGDVGARA